MSVSLIVAMDLDGVIGRDNGLPWRLPDDLAHFRKVTLGKPVVMGRRTWESIGRPLPKRRNIILTRNPEYHAEGAEIVDSPEAAACLTDPEEEVMVIGGAAVYEAFLPMARRIYLTRIQARVEGDTRFPDFEEGDFNVSSREDHETDDRHIFPFSFLVLDRA